MASGANDGSFMSLVATDADAHSHDASGLRHGAHLCDVAMAHLAFHTRVEMLAMAPVHAGCNRVNTHPGNRRA